MHLAGELTAIEQAGVKVLHFDVMDGVFAPMLTLGPPFIKSVKTRMLKDVHLMIDEPVDKLPGYVAAGADMITVHVESTRHIHRALQQLKTARNANDAERGVLRGVALNPGTPLATLDPLLDEVDIVFLLAVNPGWSGQAFIEKTIERLCSLKATIAETGKPILTGLDGGVTKENIDRIARLGVDLIVTGSAVFDGKAPADNAKFMLEAAFGESRGHNIYFSTSYRALTVAKELSFVSPKYPGSPETLP